MFFSSFGGGGGFPFEGPGMGGAAGRRGPPKAVDNERLYKVLELPKNASDADIKRAYRKLAIKHHPDKGGDPETFKEISQAYAVLSDPEKRKTYDEFGEEGLEGQAGGDGTDIFDMLFGGGRGRRPQGKRRGEDIEAPIRVTLAQLYNGCSRKLAITKRVICSTCEGLGGKREQIRDCKECKGTGIRTIIRQIGPMLQQSQGPCSSCRGGKVIPPEAACRSCEATGVQKTKKVLEVFVPKGAPHGHRIIFRGEADELPNCIPGDVKFIVQQVDHDVFQRKGPHLFMKKELSLYEALTGFQFCVKHLDERSIVVSSKPHEILSSGTVKVIRSEGMPVHRNPFERGNLFIELSVRMPQPNELCLKGDALCQALRKVLPAPRPITVPEDAERVVVDDPKDEDLRQPSKNAGSQAYDDEDEDSEEGGPQRVQCTQQ